MTAPDDNAIPQVDAQVDAPAEEALPQQEEYWRAPERFGSVPVDAYPKGYDRHQRFRKLYLPIHLPIQVVERVPLGAPDLEPNRLVWGDCLHVMRQLPSASIDYVPGLYRPIPPSP